MTLMVLGLIIFVATHSLRIIAPEFRDAAVRRLGRGGWSAIHGLMALIGLVLIIYGFGIARSDPVVVWTPPFFMKHIAYLVLLPVFPLLIAAYVPGHIKARLKHPMLVAIKAWALAHLLVNGTLADIVLFAAILVWAVGVRISMKRRPPVTVETPRAIFDVIAVVIGLVIYAAVLFFLHAALIGVSPLG